MDKKILILAVVVVVVITIGSVSAFFMFAGDNEEVGGSPLVDLEEFVLNLTSSKYNYLKVKFSLELESAKDRKVIDSNLPKIRDMINAYLYGVREEEMRGPVFVQYLKEEIASRLNKVLYPAKVKNVLIDQVLMS